MSYYSSPNPNLIDYAKNYSGIKTLIVGFHDLRFVLTVTLLGLKGHATIRGSFLTLTLRHALLSSRVELIVEPENKMMLELSDVLMSGPMRLRSANTDNFYAKMV